MKDRTTNGRAIKGGNCEHPPREYSILRNTTNFFFRKAQHLIFSDKFNVLYNFSGAVFSNDARYWD